MRTEEPRKIVRTTHWIYDGKRKSHQRKVVSDAGKPFFSLIIPFSDCNSISPSILWEKGRKGEIEFDDFNFEFELSDVGVQILTMKGNMTTFSVKT